MTVRIDIDLNAKDAFVKLAILERRFGQLDDRIGKIGDNFDLGVGEQIQQLVSDLEELDDTLDDLGQKLQQRGGAGSGLDEAARTVSPDGGVGVNRGSDNDRGSGIVGKDPDLPGPARMAGRIEDRFSLSRGTIEADRLDGMQIGEIRADIAEFIDTNNGTGYSNRGLMVMNAVDDLLPGDDGSFFDTDDDDGGGITESMRDNFSFLDFWKGQTKQAYEGDMDFDTASRSIRGMTPNLHRLRDGMSDQLPRIVRRVNNNFGRLSNTLKRLKPNMRKIWNFIALMLPLLIAFGANALGVAAAMGAVAAAGAALVAGGLLGHADSMGEAFEQAKYQLRDFKEDLWEVFSPTFQQFAPISADFLDFAPAQIEKVANAMEGLTAYEGVLFESFSGAMDWITAAVRGIAESEEAVSQLAMRFGELLGNSIIDFFGWLLRESRENQQMLIELGEALYDIAVIIYRVSVAMARFAIVLKPAITFLRMLSGLLQNELVMGLIAFAVGFMYTLKVMTSVIMVAYNLYKAIMLVRFALMLLGSGSLLSGLMRGLGMLSGMLSFLITKFLAMSTAAQIAAASIAAATLGASLAIGGAAAGMAMSSIPGGEDGRKVIEDNRTVNINGTGDDFSSQQKIVDTINRQEGIDEMTSTGTDGSFRTNTTGG